MIVVITTALNNYFFYVDRYITYILVIHNKRAHLDTQYKWLMLNHYYYDSSVNDLMRERINV